MMKFGHNSATCGEEDEIVMPSTQTEKEHISGLDMHGRQREDEEPCSTLPTASASVTTHHQPPCLCGQLKAERSLTCEKCRMKVHLSCTKLPVYQLCIFLKTVRKFTCEQCASIYIDESVSEELQAAILAPQEVDDRSQRGVSTGSASQDSITASHQKGTLKALLLPPTQLQGHQMYSDDAAAGEDWDGTTAVKKHSPVQQPRVKLEPGVKVVPHDEWEPDVVFEPGVQVEAGTTTQVNPHMLTPPSAQLRGGRFELKRVKQEPQKTGPAECADIGDSESQSAASTKNTGSADSVCQHPTQHSTVAEMSQLTENAGDHMGDALPCTDQRPGGCLQSDASLSVTDFVDSSQLKVKLLMQKVKKACAQSDVSLGETGGIKTQTSHSGKKRHKCTQCDASFSRSNHLKDHMVTHTGQKPYKCTLCDASFTQSGSLRTHMMIHTGQKPHKCLLCDARFREACGLKRHMFTHAGEKPYECTECNAAFGHAGALRNHTVVCHGPKRHKCDQCDISFKQAFQLRNHMLAHAGQAPPRPHQCTECGACFASLWYLKAHMRSHSGEKPHKCTQCSSAFTHKSGLRSHMRIHTGQKLPKRHQCTQCGACFAGVSCLKTHMFTHTGEKPLKCPHCAAAFAHRSSLRRHVLIHSGQKPYKCSQCDSSFRQSDLLKDHMQTHTGAKQHKCALCAAAYAHKRGLRRHMLVHRGQKLYTCSQCDSRFKQASEWREHMLTHTGEKLLV